MSKGNSRGQSTLSDTAREWSTSQGFDTSMWPPSTATPNVAWRRPIRTPSEATHAVRSPQAVLIRCSLRDYRGYHDRPLAFFLKSWHPTSLIKDILANADPKHRLRAFVDIVPSSPCELVVEGVLTDETEARRDEIVSKAEEEIKKLIASVAENAAFDAPGVSAVDIMNDVRLQKALKRNNVTYSNFPTKNGEITKVVLSYLKGNEDGRDEIKQLFLQIRPASHVEAPNRWLKGPNDRVESIVSQFDHDSIAELARSLTKRPLGHFYQDTWRC